MYCFSFIIILILLFTASHISCSIILVQAAESELESQFCLMHVKQQYSDLTFLKSTFLPIIGRNVAIFQNRHHCYIGKVS